MTLEIPDEMIPLIVTALDTQYAYTRAIQRDNSAYKEAADFFRERLPKDPEKPPRRGKK